MRRHAAANRERILAAAEAVFGAKGAHGSTEEVARHAEVGIGTVFRHFPTKDALIEAALVRHFELLGEQADALAADLAPASALQALVTTMIDTGASKITLASLVGDDGVFPDPVLAAAEAVRASVGRVLARAQDAGAVHANVTINELYFLIRALAQARATMPSDAATIEAAVDVVLRGLIPATAALGDRANAPATG